MLRPGPVIILLWAAFWISWFAAAAWSARTERRVDLKGQLAYRIVLIAGAIAFLPRAHGYYGPLRLWRRWLREELDQGAYDDYRRRVPMLVPFGPR
jgi:protein-S-isoprenylcysteine O-methyltransferase Ste14